MLGSREYQSTGLFHGKNRPEQLNAFLELPTRHLASTLALFKNLTHDSEIFKQSVSFQKVVEKLTEMSKIVENSISDHYFAKFLEFIRRFPAYQVRTLASPLRLSLFFFLLIFSFSTFWNRTADISPLLT